VWMVLFLTLVSVDSIVSDCSLCGQCCFLTVVSVDGIVSDFS
jgi:hypothetical protein